MTHSYINLEFLRNFTQNDQAQLKKFIQIFLDNAPTLLVQVQTGRENSDYDSIRTAVHTLKSQVAYMGMHGIKETIVKCEALAAEQKGGEEFENDLQAIIDFIENGIAELRQEIA